MVLADFTVFLSFDRSCLATISSRLSSPNTHTHTPLPLKMNRLSATLNTADVLILLSRKVISAVLHQPDPIPREILSSSIILGDTHRAIRAASFESPAPRRRIIALEASFRAQDSRRLKGFAASPSRFGECRSNVTRRSVRRHKCT